MKKYSNKAVLFFITLFFISLNIYAAPKLEYTLSMEKPYTHFFQVEMKISELNKDSIDVKMPVWAPGSYLVRDFPKNVEYFNPENLSADRQGLNGKKLDFKKIDKNTWRIYTQKSSDIKINYNVYAFENSIRTSFLDDSHGYLNGTSVFMYIDGMKELPSTLKIIPYKGWQKISTGLERIEGEENSANEIPPSYEEFYSPNYDVLADSPIEIGNQKVYHFKAAGVDHEIAIYGDGNYEIDSLLKDLPKIVEAQTKIFGENPNKRYVFIFHNSDTRGGGLEHLNSTTLQFKRFEYKPESQYKAKILSTVSHEYFHLWNVKRFRPLELGPFNYNKENYTNLLWVAEGITDYYADLILQRTGIYDRDEFLQVLSKQINGLENRPGRKVQSVAEASFDAWIKDYQPNENSYNTTISYYQKGFILGALLDLEIIKDTNGKQSLDDVLKYVYNEYYKKRNRGITDKEWQNAVEKFAGKSLNDFFKDYVFGTKEIDYQKYFHYAGIEILDYSSSTKPYLGIRSSMKDGKLIVNTIIDSSSAYFGDLNAKDEIIAVNNFRVDKDILDKIISSSEIGDSLNITVSRDGIIKNLNVILKENENVNYSLFRNAEPTDKQNMIYKKWLR